MLAARLMVAGAVNEVPLVGEVSTIVGGKVMMFVNAASVE